MVRLGPMVLSEPRATTEEQIIPMTGKKPYGRFNALHFILSKSIPQAQQRGVPLSPGLRFEGECLAFGNLPWHLPSDRFCHTAVSQEFHLLVSRLVPGRPVYLSNTTFVGFHIGEACTVRRLLCLLHLRRVFPDSGPEGAWKAPRADHFQGYRGCK